MIYRYLEHMADIGIEAEGASVEEAVASAAEGVLALFFTREEVEERERYEITATAPTTELLFIEVINEIISLRDRENLALTRLTGIALSDDGGEITLKATALGEPFDADRHSVGTEVKAATYSGLNYELRGGRHSFRCVLDL